MRRVVLRGMFNTQWVMLKRWQDAWVHRGEKVHCHASSESTTYKTQRSSAAFRCPFVSHQIPHSYRIGYEDRCRDRIRSPDLGVEPSSFLRRVSRMHDISQTSKYLLFRFAHGTCRRRMRYTVCSSDGSSVSAQRRQLYDSNEVARVAAHRSTRGLSSR